VLTTAAALVGVCRVDFESTSIDAPVVVAAVLGAALGTADALAHDLGTIVHAVLAAEGVAGCDSIATPFCRPTNVQRPIPMHARTTEIEHMEQQALCLSLYKCRRVIYRPVDANDYRASEIYCRYKFFNVCTVDLYLY
jgi:hypothetical protein